MIVVAIIATLASIAVPVFIRVANRAQIVRAVTDIKTFETDIAGFELEKGRLPLDLGEINRATRKDPWGRPYEYLNFAAAGGGWKGQARKDHSLVPLNTTYDLYSVGKDGASAAPLTAKSSHDDVVRAHDGGFVGLGSAF